MASKALKNKKPVKKTAETKAKPQGKAKPVARAPAVKSAVKSAPKVAKPGSASQNPMDQLKRVYKNWHETKGGNADEMIALLAEDATWGSIANGTHGIEFARELLSRSNVMNYFERFAKDWEVIFCRVERMISEGNSIVVLTETSWRHKRTGKMFMTPKVDVWDFRRGKAVSYFEYFDTASAVRNAL